MILFRDRESAGELLGERLKSFASPETVVLGLARGGVVTARAIAKKLGAKWDLICIKKVGAPWQPELALGAVSETGDHVLNEDLIEMLQISTQEIARRMANAAQEAKEKASRLRGAKGFPSIENKKVILADDGLATGATMRAAIHTAKNKGASEVIVAIPVAAHDSLELVKEEADQVVCLGVPPYFMAVGEFYEDFSQVEDEEVIEYAKELRP
jgi:putative phosphoribosyl transferase